jgi:hypothetical protein
MNPVYTEFDTTIDGVSHDVAYWRAADGTEGCEWLRARDCDQSDPHPDSFDAARAGIIDDGRAIAEDHPDLCHPDVPEDSERAELRELIRHAKYLVHAAEDLRDADTAEEAERARYTMRRAERCIERAQADLARRREALAALVAGAKERGAA